MKNGKPDESLGSLVSVVIPTYNRKRSLERCLKSLETQTFKRFEVLVCDDGSRDGSAELVQSFNQKLRIRYINVEHFGGPARPRNVGVECSECEFIAFLDSDDYWLPNKLEASIEALQKGYDVVYHDCYVFDEGKETVSELEKLSTRDLNEPVFDDLLTNGNGIINSSVVVRKSILVSAGRISEDRELISVEDFDIWLRIARLTNRFLRLDGCYGYYCRGDDNLSKLPNRLACFKRLEQFYISDISRLRRAPVWLYYLLACYHAQLGEIVESRRYAAKVLAAGRPFNLWVRSVFMFVGAILRR